ncbi:MAG: hypothetical protein NPIRA02_03720 [Nitrospirales bacterium]|nr:MAG: hypothetical protein NPIRA02_03720 [Nitrospirales bacterium]
MNKPHKQLDAWKLSMELTEVVYQQTKVFPTDEAFVLTAQMRRSAISIPSNIAEGAARRSRKEFLQYLYVAKGSLSK